MWRFVCDRCSVSIVDDNNARFHRKVLLHMCPTNMWQDVVDFHSKFELPVPDGPSLLPEEIFKFRVEFMREELDELIKAHSEGNMHEVADALVDLAYVVLGTARFMGIPFNLCWNEVQRANMSKVRVERSEQSKRGSTFDVVKPEGWVPPNHAKYITTKGDE